MSTATKRSNIIEVFKSIFSSEPDIEEYSQEELTPELKNALKALELKEKGAEQAINTNNVSNKGGFGKKINPNTEKAMRAMHKEVKQNSIEDRERE